MKLTEIQQPSDKALFEELDRNNDTGFLTEDLVKIRRSMDDKWHEPVTGDELEQIIESIGRGKTV